MTLIAIDPGKHKCAVAIFDYDWLCWVGFHDKMPRVSGHTVVLEVPQSYPRDPRKANDLIDVALAGGLAAGSLLPSKIVTYYPAWWKGQVPKPVHHNRLLDVLRTAELTLFSPDMPARVQAAALEYARTRRVKAYSNIEHNLLDAAALGCYHLGRLPGLKPPKRG